MPKYTIIVKKGDIFLELSTPNKAFIEKEFAKWVLSAADIEKKQNTNQPPQEQTEEHTSEPYLIKKEFIKPNNPIKNMEQQKTPSQKNDFENILSQKVSELPELTKEQKLEKFRKKSSSPIDDFMKCVYDLCIEERMERFSFSQINVVAEEQFGASFNYEVIQKAIDLNYIKIVPDYTGMANVVEYALDLKGERYFKDVLK